VLVRPCPTVFPDNRIGVRAAVEHLIQPGHRRIAFTGFTGALDQREGYETYCETLTAHGITPDPGPIFEAEDNQQAGGEGAAREQEEQLRVSALYSPGCRTAGTAGRFGGDEFLSCWTRWTTSTPR
jgi:DNA-binding LacI/PurR family transcriptional regulator